MPIPPKKAAARARKRTKAEVEKEFTQVRRRLKEARPGLEREAGRTGPDWARPRSAVGGKGDGGERGATNLRD